jgi:deoxyribodipyrimidine photo-lyase
MSYARALCWIRRDLRLSDHTALAEATRQSAAVAVVFVFDAQILKGLARDDRRLTFIADSLAEIDRELHERGSALIVRHGDPVTEIPRLAAEMNVDAVFCNRDYEPYARTRDTAVAKALERGGVAFQAFKDQVILEEREVVSQAGSPYTVFTPYRNAWQARLTEADCADRRPQLDRLAPRAGIAGAVAPWSLERIGFARAPLWLEPGAGAAERRRRAFLRHLDRYHERRDFPSDRSATSGLSAHLRFGTISVRALVRAALKRDSRGAETWLSELIWRDFYQMILACFPHVVRGAFRAEYDCIRWPGSKTHFECWCRGETGYPLVDAAMRHFNRTGWMHNRLRMVTASFLVKDLLVDWRLGEAYFARHLLDFDLAANNGGWQWSASTGCDAQPYFRIFNPVTQSRRFDPEGAFIRAELPELAGFTSRDIHWPAGVPEARQAAAGCRIGRDYAAPIVDHALQRKLAVELFAAARNS